MHRQPRRIPPVAGFIAGCFIVGLGVDLDTWTLILLGLGTAVGAPFIRLDGEDWELAAGIAGGLALIGLGLDLDWHTIVFTGVGLTLAAPFLFLPEQAEDQGRAWGRTGDAGPPPGHVGPWGSAPQDDAHGVQGTVGGNGDEGRVRTD